MRGEAEDVGRLRDPAEIEEFADGLVPQPFDIERAAADEMAQPFLPLRRTDQPAGAADIDLAFLGQRFRIAFRAMGREGPGVAEFVASQILDDLRDDIARALEHDTVARPHAEPRDL